MNTEELYKECHRLFEYKEGHLIRRTFQKGSKVGICIKNKYHVLSVKKIQYSVHRIVFLMFNKNLPKCIDHIDGDTLNNNIENLRSCTLSQNSNNRKMSKNNLTGFKGVCLCKKSNRYRVNIMSQNKNYYLGMYATAIEGAKAYDEKALKIHGKFAKTNKMMGLY